MATRQRQVFPRDEVAHRWAHQAQDSARDAGDNFYFNGPTIFSYGAHFAIAHILDSACGDALGGVVLWNESGYSNTTSKHKFIAYGALTRQQRENHLSVPDLDRDSAQGIDSALREKRLPIETEKVLAKVRENIAALDGKKHGSGPFEHALQQARQYEKTALAFYKRAGKKYPLPIVPAGDDVPVAKTERAAFILTFARGELQAQYKKNIGACEHALERVREQLTAPSVHVYDLRRVVDLARHAAQWARDAAKNYAALNPGKPTGAKVKKLQRDCAEMVEKAEQTLRDVEREEARAELTRITKRYIWARHHVKHGSAKHENALYECIYHSGCDIGDKARGQIDSLLIPFAEKLQRAANIDALQRQFKRVRNDIESGDSYALAQHGSADARRMYRQAIRAYNRLSSQAASDNMKTSAWRHFVGNLPAEIERINAACIDIENAIAARNAETVRAWCAGESNARPSHEAGTFARINPFHKVVETTRGATVPIEHACRLARMYAVTVRRGGAEWRDGAGPMVGHYRVNQIGADGSLVIGCHEFTPSEAQRLYDVLSACKECTATAETTQGE